jgi:hypothetical protein
MYIAEDAAITAIGTAVGGIGGVTAVITVDTTEVITEETMGGTTEETMGGTTGIIIEIARVSTLAWAFPYSTDGQIITGQIITGQTTTGQATMVKITMGLATIHDAHIVTMGIRAAMCSGATAATGRTEPTTTRSSPTMDRVSSAWGPTDRAMK